MSGSTLLGQTCCCTTETCIKCDTCCFSENTRLKLTWTITTTGVTDCNRSATVTSSDFNRDKGTDSVYGAKYCGAVFWYVDGEPETLHHTNWRWYFVSQAVGWRVTNMIADTEEDQRGFAVIKIEDGEDWRTRRKCLAVLPESTELGGDCCGTPDYTWSDIDMGMTVQGHPPGYRGRIKDPGSEYDDCTNPDAPGLRCGTMTARIAVDVDPYDNRCCRNTGTDTCSNSTAANCAGDCP